MARLFERFDVRELHLKNRIVISPMCQHAAEDGRATDWHLVHLGRFAIGGAGLVLLESTAVDARSRIGACDLGLWDDSHVAPLRRVVDFVKANGAAIGVQLAHSGRKAGSHALWEGGQAFTAEELEASPLPWLRMGPSANPAGPDWSKPVVMDDNMIAEAVDKFAAAARRADAAGFDVVELHFGHGYLAASFLSPVSNQRTDNYGGSLENRMRFPLRIASTVREAWPASKPLFVRISAVDGAEGGWNTDDSVIFARELKRCGVDVIDCSSGGLSEETRAANVPRGLGFQVPFAERIRREADIPTQAVGVIVDAQQAEAVLQEGKADLIAIGRQALFEPNWANQAALELMGDAGFERWNIRHGSWLQKRAPLLRKLKEDAELNSSAVR